jgi:hypothetical protein
MRVISKRILLSALGVIQNYRKKWASQVVADLLSLINTQFHNLISRTRRPQKEQQLMPRPNKQQQMPQPNEQQQICQMNEQKQNEQPNTRASKKRKSPPETTG